MGMRGINVGMMGIRRFMVGMQGMRAIGVGMGGIGVEMKEIRVGIFV